MQEGADINDAVKFRHDLIALRRYTVAAVILWSIIVVISLGWNILNERHKTLELARNEAMANFNKDQALRFWAARHGGIYVPPDDRTPPNPALSHIPDRDIISNFGKKYTLMNPAYMLRQVMQEFGDLYGIKGRITSLKLLNPNNAPDEWEIKALMAFERGVKEVFEINDIKGIPYLRLMRPMIVGQPCLKCHEYQGYKVGDVRGGVGVSVPMTPYYELEKMATITMLLSHSGFWLLGLGAIALVFTRSKRRIIELARANEGLQASRRKLSCITSVLKGIPILFIRR
ncbi:Signal transduction histidine kinase [Candidatus Magnetobacterium bavaricum]|uniref:Signal transduction histidine kinase n=1 Tax=Candidatus Magnetobacterium bavaricum TaxID=29290 RepID=A0A0F3H092_9BACT|nr:Signal transduction histidine kinase [Candidatus Magnetobacterium bavaricum]